MKKENDFRLPGLEMPVNAPASELEVVAPNVPLLIATIAILIVINFG